MTDATTPEELFGIFAGMISPLEDAHTFIDARVVKKTYQGVRRTPSFLQGAARDAGYRHRTGHRRRELHAGRGRDGPGCGD